MDKKSQDKTADIISEVMARVLFMVFLPILVMYWLSTLVMVFHAWVNGLNAQIYVEREALKVPPKKAN